jgi:hypothetical protein
MMSLVKAVPNGIKDKERKRFSRQERPPIPYVPEKGPIQEMVSTLKSDQSLKTTIGEPAELHIPIWHTGMHRAFPMHLNTVHNTIKKRGTFKAYKEACKAYVEQCKAVKQAKATLALLANTASEGKSISQDASKKFLRRLHRRPRKAWLHPTHQPQNCAQSIRLTMRKPSLMQRLPRTSAKLLLLRCFSSTQICCL